MTTARINKLRELARAERMDYIAILPGSNLIYFTNVRMHLSERPIVALFPADATRQPALIVPSFEVGKARRYSPGVDWNIYSYADGQPYQSAFDDALKPLGSVTIGVEPEGMRFLELTMMRTAAPSAKFVSADGVIKQMRMVKDAGEVAAMRKAIGISESALADVLKMVKPGMTEAQVARALMDAGAKHGADEGSFEPLVQSGLNAAFPHGASTKRAINPGDGLLMDFGFRADGYPADITRTVFVGEPSAEMRKIYETVKAANAAGRAAVKPGVSGQEVDRATRKVIEDAGYGAYFTHRTGHGLGLDVHEAPYMVEGNTAPLQPGNTFTIEPGIYIEGLGGVRIEDNMLVTETGGESLTTFGRDLMIVG